MSYGFVLRDKYKGAWKQEETRHYCKICNCWLSKSNSAMRKHEQGAQHQLKKKQLFISMRKEKQQGERADKELSKQLRDIEKAAKAAYNNDLSTGVAGGRGRFQSQSGNGTGEYREYRPPGMDELQRGVAMGVPGVEGKASANFVEFYNKKYGHGTEGGGVQKSGDPAPPLKVGTKGWGMFSEDKKYYRAEIIKVAPPKQKTKKELNDEETDKAINGDKRSISGDMRVYTVRYTDYGNEEELDRDSFTTNEPALWCQPPTNSTADLSNPARNDTNAQGIDKFKPKTDDGNTSEVQNTNSGAGAWETVTTPSESVWASNRARHAKREKEKKKKEITSRFGLSDKYSGGDANVGFADVRDIDEDDYGLKTLGKAQLIDDEQQTSRKKMEFNFSAKRVAKEETTTAPGTSAPDSSAGSKPKIAFKKRGKKRSRNIREASEIS